MKVLSRKQSIVLNYPKLRQRIDSRDVPAKEELKALKHLKEIQADFSTTWIEMVIKILDHTLMRVYDGIRLDTDNFDSSLIDKHCVVLVPNHQSHADYLAMNYIFYKIFKKPLYVSGGINLNVFPLGIFFRRCGCFFIRRSFKNDITYKLTLEAYLYYLLRKGRYVEFFFEGGRSRSGKLRPPRYGFYSMLLDAHQVLASEFPQRKLLFVPTSINHEYVPETKSLVKELKGAKKKRESTGQVFGVFKFFNYQFGNVHIRFGNPVNAQALGGSSKDVVQKLAFDCFREVGRNLVVNPSSLVSMALLDEPSGALMWSDLLARARAVRNYCHKFSVPYSEGLAGDKMEPTLERVMDIFIGNRKVDVIGKRKRGNVYYAIRKESREELLYFKNSILHHFLVPSIINLAWVNLLRGQLGSVEELKHFFLSQRRQFKHEFYLPTVKQFFYLALNIISDAVGRRVGSLSEIVALSRKDIYSVVCKVGVFGRSLSYVLEAYYLAALNLRRLGDESPGGFKMDIYRKKLRELYLHEVNVGRVVKYPESYSVELVKSSMDFFKLKNMVTIEARLLRVTDKGGLDKLIQKYEKDLTDLVTFNIRPQ